MSASLSDGIGISVPSFTFRSKHTLRTLRDRAPSTTSNDRKHGWTSSALRSARNESKKGRTTQWYTSGTRQPPTALWSIDAIQNSQCIIEGWIILDHSFGTQ